MDKKYSSYRANNFRKPENMPKKYFPGIIEYKVVSRYPPSRSCFFPVRNVLKTANQCYLFFLTGIDVNFTTREERVAGSCVANKSNLLPDV